MIAGDTETTDLLKPAATELHLQPFITEICLLKFNSDFEITDAFETLVRPIVPIPDNIVTITGITNDMVRRAPRFIEIYDDLCEFVRGEKVFYAHNCTFDIGMIEVELMRHDLVNKFPWPSDQRCTIELSMPIENKRLKLGYLYEMATGKKLENAHRARNDVEGMIECIKWLRDRGLDND